VTSVRIVQPEVARVNAEWNEAGEDDAGVRQRREPRRTRDAKEFPRCKGGRNGKERRERRSSVDHDGDGDRGSDDAERDALGELRAQEMLKRCSDLHDLGFFRLDQVIDLLDRGVFSNGDREMFRPLIESLLTRDDYMLLADYQSYVDCQQQVSNAYRDQANWTRMSILNTARAARFSSDRSIRDYCRDIWNVPVPVTSGA